MANAAVRSAVRAFGRLGAPVVPTTSDLDADAAEFGIDYETQAQELSRESESLLNRVRGLGTVAVASFAVAAFLLQNDQNSSRAQRLSAIALLVALLALFACFRAVYIKGGKREVGLRVRTEVQLADVVDRYTRVVFWLYSGFWATGAAILLLAYIVIAEALD